MGTGKWGITRQAAMDLMEQSLEAENLRKHSEATEAIMRALAPRFNEDPEMWGIAGLLHDLDYNETREAIDRHGLVTEKILADKGVHPDVIEAIKFHNAEHLGLTATKPIHFALSAAETITGMIVTTTLVYPDKKLASVKSKSVGKRMKEKEFARAVNRDRILLCEKIDIPLDEFISISIEAMKKISDRLGL
ncbi:MAG: HDIG domain-containing metalloprotein [Desulfomonile sp.]|jgi:putative nucleotidyltransferase with HDIG domain|nr:HDIG domain-containing protein [Deltaproteobacteria bacterium]